MSQPSDSPPFTAEEFRASLGQFATGVTIVTARDANGQLVGLTANSFNSVSLSPPLVLWSLGAQSATLPGFRSAMHYAINVLAADQRLLAERFARRGIDRFEGTAWRPGLTGAPSGFSPTPPACAWPASGPPPGARHCSRPTAARRRGWPKASGRPWKRPMTRPPAERAAPSRRPRAPSPPQAAPR